MHDKIRERLLNGNETEILDAMRKVIGLFYSKRSRNKCKLIRPVSMVEQV